MLRFIIRSILASVGRLAFWGNFFFLTFGKLQKVPLTFYVQSKVERDWIFCVQIVLCFTSVCALVLFLVHIVNEKTSPIEGAGNLERALFVLY